MTSANVNLKTSLVIFLGIMISVSSFLFLKSWEKDNLINEFTYRAEDHAAAILSRLQNAEKSVRDVRFLIEHDIVIEHDDPLKPNDFMLMAEKLVIDDPALTSIAWSIIKTASLQATLHTKKRHLKVIYVKDNPRLKSRTSDVNLNDYYDEHIGVKVAANNRLIQVYIHQDNNSKISNEINFIGYVGTSMQNKPSNFSGEAIGAVIIEWNVQKLIRSALFNLPVSAQDISLLKVNHDGSIHPVYTHLSRSRTSEDGETHTGLNMSVPLNFSGQDWLLKFEAAPQFFRNHPSVMAVPGLLICLLLTFIAAWYIRSISRQTLVIEKKVNQRTNELKASTKRITKLATVIEQSEEIVIITDKDGVIEYVNPAFVRISGFSSDEAIGKKPNIVKSDFHSEKFYNTMWNRLNSGKPWVSDFTNQSKSGDAYEVSQSITPIFDNNTIIGFSSVQRDITIQRQMQRKLQHSDRVESLGVLAGGIAHDFNNLLTAILGHASLATKKLDVTSPILRHIDAIENASQSAANLCRQMLAYSGKGKFVVKAIDLSELVENMGKLIEVSLTKNIVLRYELNEQLPAIDADIAQIQQIVLNLITNASEAIEGKSGVISVTTGIMNVDTDYLNSCIAGKHTEGHYVYLEVSDTGCGMDKKTKEKMFDPFFSTKFTGRGLGMSAMLGIVQGHQGAMRVYSEVGKGTVIKVAFPISHETIESLEKTKDYSPEWAGSGTVLVIDDEESIRELATIMLEDFGFNVITANDGQEGLKTYQNHKGNIVLVLLDMTMPKLDGAACFSQLKNINPDVRVLLSSGYNEQDATNRFVGKGLAGFIQKPYSADAFAKKLQEVL